MLASAFTPNFGSDEGTVIFASGVSISTETRESEFDREELLLDRSLRDRRKLVYFSSCAVANPHQPDTPYFRHKRRMEKLVLDASGVVFRLPQVVGRSHNPNTLTNFLFDHISRGVAFDVWTNVERNLIDVEHVAGIAHRLLSRASTELSQPVSIANPTSTPMIRIVEAFEVLLGRKGNFRRVEKTLKFPIDTEMATAAAAELDIRFGDQYLNQLLQKYYGQP